MALIYTSGMFCNSLCWQALLETVNGQEAWILVLLATSSTVATRG
jgi:hypothetical protein